MPRKLFALVAVAALAVSAFAAQAATVDDMFDAVDREDVAVELAQAANAQALLELSADAEVEADAEADAEAELYPDRLPAFNPYAAFADPTSPLEQFAMAPSYPQEMPFDDIPAPSAAKAKKGGKKDKKGGKKDKKAAGVTTKAAPAPPSRPIAQLPVPYPEDL